MNKEDFTYQDKLDELKLDLSHPKSKGKTFIIVEGDSDIKIYRKLYNTDFCKIEEIPGGKPKVYDAVIALSIFSIMVIGIQDADFHNLIASDKEHSSIYRTDFHDLELMITTSSTVFESLLFDNTKLERKEHELQKQKLLQMLKKVSCFKLLNIKYEFELNFRGMGFVDVCDFSNFSLDISKYIEKTLVRSPNKKIENINLLEEVEKLYSEDIDLLQITNGHDFIKLLSSYFHYLNPSSSVSIENISSSCRISYSVDFFKKTDLYFKTYNSPQNKTNNFCFP